MRSMSGSFVEISVNNLSFRTSRGEAFVDQRKSVRWSQPKKKCWRLSSKDTCKIGVPAPDSQPWPLTPAACNADSGSSCHNWE